jgi:PKHD-type hydroxylase
MLLELPGLLDPARVAALRARLEGAAWMDGRVTAGHQSALAKHNDQLAQDDPLAIEAGREILAALQASALFMAAAVPHSVYPPLFNRYAPGQHFGNHVDNAIRAVPGGGRVRTDLSATLFLSDPTEYDGGELCVDDTYGAHRVKLGAGSLILYPASSLHRVNPVTRGVRLAAFFWVQSLVRDDARRTLLFDLDLSIQRLRQAVGDHEALITQTAIYHNLLRLWAEP